MTVCIITSTGVEVTLNAGLYTEAVRTLIERNMMSRNGAPHFNLLSFDAPKGALRLSDTKQSPPLQHSSILNENRVAAIEGGLRQLFVEKIQAAEVAAKRDEILASQN